VHGFVQLNALSEFMGVGWRRDDCDVHARRSIGDYLSLYNQKRPHSSLADHTPDEAYFTTLASIKWAARSARAFHLKISEDSPNYRGHHAERPRDSLIEFGAQGIVPCSGIVMDYRVSYEHSLKNKPDEFIVRVPSQLVDDVPANVPRALLPECITDLILKRSPLIGKIRHLRIL
jgi:hypothetical protein